MSPSSFLEPLRLFHRWFAAAARRQSLAEACCLSTVSPSGVPQGRMVLLKAADAKGFCFYTNLKSPKARSLRRNPAAALTFHWPSQGRQVRVEGRVRPVSAREADAYFASRPRFSRLAAWASRQSAPLPSRRVLLRRFLAVSLRFRGRDVPRPPFWSGYRLVPRRMEFWEARPHRLHDRVLYVRRGGRWTRTRLYP